MKAGDYVICIDDSNWNEEVFERFNTIPVAGRVYQIRRVIPHWSIKNGPDGLALAGIFGDWDIFETFDGREIYEEYHFRQDRFKLTNAETLEDDCESPNKHLQDLVTTISVPKQTDREIMDDYLARFKEMSNQQIVDAFNKQVMVGCVFVRRQLLYTIALREVMEERFHSSPIYILNSEGPGFKSKIVLVEDKIYLSE